VIGNFGKAWPDSCEQDGHALTASRGLDTMYRERAKATSDRSEN